MEPIKISELPEATPPANFQCGMVRVDKAPPLNSGFKASYLRLRMLTELKAIEIAVAKDVADPECFKEIEDAINRLTDEQIFEIHIQLERNL